MAALTTDRGGQIQIGPVLDQYKFPMAANTTIYLGSLVSFDASGNLIPAADTAAQASKAVYLALEGATNGTTAGETRCMCMTRGTLIANAAGVNPVLAANRGSQAHAVSDNEVATTSTNSRAFGRVVDVTSAGVLIEI
jgi:hypothetical protein